MQLSYESFLLKKKLWTWTALLLVLQACLLGLLKPELAFLVVVGLLATALGVVYPDQAIFFYFLASWLPLGQYGRVRGRHGTAQGIYFTQFWLGFIAFVWVFRMISDRKIRFQVRRADVALMGLCLAYFLSTVVSHLTWNLKIQTSHRYLITQFAQVGIVLMCAFAYWTIANGIRSEIWARKMLYAFMSLGVVLALIKLPFIVRFWHRAGIDLVRPGLLMMQGSMLAFGQFIYAPPDKRMRWLLLGAFPFSMVMHNMYWVSGWMGGMTALFTLLLFGSRKALAAFFLFAVVLGVVQFSYFERRLVHHSRATGDFHRFFLLEDSVRMWREYPLFGIGPGNYYQAYSHHYARLWNRPIIYATAHTNYGEILATTGIVGFGAFWIFFSLVGWDLFTYWRKAVDPVQKGFLLGIMAGSAGILAASIAGDYVIPDRANYGLKTFSTAVYFWLILGMGQAIGRRWLITEKET